MKKARFEALVFDMDGTLTRPTLDFSKIRREIGLPAGDVVQELRRLPPGRQAEAWKIIERYEQEAMEKQTPQEGCLELLELCRRAGVRVGVVTRNTQRSVEHFARQHQVTFDGVVAREFPFMKPHPQPILHLLNAWRIEPARALTIGDYVHDIDSGRAAGTRTCFFQNAGATFHGAQADFVVTTMLELQHRVFPDEDV